ncbi:hypothetical protein AALO_G00100480 [Alosa alosa]|uniref:C2H2-type domain-containing protein n=1 Tax=Alosa alosa TaxID=278164 RepID=A0AAV6GTW1_9TELE|nr:hypothetical protein AALO_G00100480 [Alosa alosa]
MESNLLLRIQVEDLQKRLDEKENKLTHAQETISALRNEVQSLQEQLAFEKRKHQKPQSLRSRHVRAKIEAKTLVCRDPPSADLSCRTGFSPTDPSCNDITEGLARSQNVVSHNLPIMSENWPLPWRARTNDVCVDQPTIFLSCVVEPNLTQSSSFGRNRARSPQQCPVKTLLVSIEDCRHKLGPDGVFKLLDRKDAEEADVFDEGSNHKHKNEDLFSGMEDSFLVKHKEERMNGLYCCSQCSRRFSKPILLNLHLKMHGISQEQAQKKKKMSSNTPPRCGTCGKVFSSRAYLKVHQRVHTNEKPYACVVCDRTFATSSNLYTHQRTRHKGQSSTCGECGRSFPCLSQEKPIACASCSAARKVRLLGKLQEHLRQRAQDKPHQCPRCPMRFASASGARSHERSHAGERPLRLVELRSEVRSVC